MNKALHKGNERAAEDSGPYKIRTDNKDRYVIFVGGAVP